jgi:phosphatidate cytidylyltransferase
MLAQRIIVSIIIAPLIVVLFFFGGWLMAGVLAGVLGFAAWEYWRIFRTGGYNPSAPVLIAGVGLLILLRYQFTFTGSDLFFSAAVLISMATQVVYYEKGANSAAVDFNITLGGILYLGWMGAYIISIRQLPAGEWWLLLVLPACWIGDAGAYLFGSRFGRHKLSKRVSPNKSWEGYAAGVVTIALLAPLLGAFYHQFAPEITALKGLAVGVIIGIIAPLGDLGESMLKRGFGVKDSSRVIPGHGGIMDRIDSWLWAAPIGYYLIVWFL